MTEEQFAFHVEVEQKNEEKSLTFFEKVFEKRLQHFRCTTGVLPEEAENTKSFFYGQQNIFGVKIVWS